jgi:N-acetylglucosamine kinase-like BadF-type ATPase
MRAVLGLDSGGTKCDALLLREDGTALGWGHADVKDKGAGRAWLGSGRSVKTISRAGFKALAALGDDPCAHLHISAVAGWLPMGFWRRSPVEDVHLHVVQEYEGAMALAGVEHGIVALAGTGAFIFGCTRENKRVFFDGFGPLLGDYGGGYQVGFLAVRAVAKTEWHPRHETSLRDRVFDALGIEAPRNGYSLIGILAGDQPRGRDEIAALARIVDEEAERGDRVALGILHQAADDFAETLADAVAYLEMGAEPYPLVGTGGITRSRLFWERFCARALEINPQFTPFRSDLPPVVGLALPALFTLGAAPRDQLRERALATTRDLLARVEAGVEGEVPEPTIVFPVERR